MEHAKCAHGPCACEAAPGNLYCGDYCKFADAKSAPDLKSACGCGHFDCYRNDASSAHVKDQGV
jgi:hypothetical protein